MKRVEFDGMEFLRIVDNKVNILFSTAKNNISYKLGEQDTLNNFEKLKDIFNVDKVNYTNQVHSDNIINLDFIDARDKEADGLILSKRNEISGIFTADCVSVIIYDSVKNVIATVHSGWKSTILDISKQAVEILKKEYNCNNIKVVIGPAVGICCYQVSEELAERFRAKYGDTVTNERMLNLKEVIKVQLEGLVGRENIIDTNICTNCNKDFELHSYRKKKEEAGRLFSFAFIQD